MKPMTTTWRYSSTAKAMIYNDISQPRQISRNITARLGN